MMLSTKTISLTVSLSSFPKARKKLRHSAVCSCTTKVYRTLSLRLSARGVNHYKRYGGTLPHNLTFDKTNADIVREYAFLLSLSSLSFARIGEPQGRSPKNMVTGIFIDYKLLGLQVPVSSPSFPFSASSSTLTDRSIS